MRDRRYDQDAPASSPRRLANHWRADMCHGWSAGPRCGGAASRLRLEVVWPPGGDVRHVPVDLVRGLDDSAGAHLPDGHERWTVQRSEAGREATAHALVVDRELPASASCLDDLDLSCGTYF